MPKITLTTVANEAEEIKVKAEEKNVDDIIALQQYFRDQEELFFDYFLDKKVFEKIRKIKILPRESGQDRAEIKSLRSIVDRFNWSALRMTLVATLKDVYTSTYPFAIENARFGINTIDKIRKSSQTQVKAFDDTVEYMNSPLFASDALGYIEEQGLGSTSDLATISKGIDNTTADNIYRELYDGIENLESMDDLGVRVQSVYAEATQSRSLMIARTETMRAFNKSTILAYEKAEIKKAQWLISNDERTCEICLPLHGLVVPIKEAQNTLPVHPRCRCTWIPVVGDPILMQPDDEMVYEVLRNNPNLILNDYIKVPANVRGHLPSMIDDYEKVQNQLIKDAKRKGIDLKRYEADNIKYGGVDKFCGNMNCSKVRTYQDFEMKLGRKPTIDDLYDYIELSGKTEVNNIARSADLIEDFIKISPDYDNKTGLFRALKELDDDAINMFKNIKPGDVVNMEGTSSFTSFMQHSMRFSSEDNPYFIIKSGIDAKKSASVKYISKSSWENEVIFSKNAKFKVKQVIQKDYVINSPEAKELLIEYADDMTMRANLEHALSKHTNTIIYIEPI